MTEPDFHIALKNEVKNLQHNISHQFVFKKYNVKIVSLNRKDSGMTELFKAKILIKNRKKRIEFVIKKAPIDSAQQKSSLTESSFRSEIYFYTEACPSLKKLEEKHRLLKSFIPVAEYVTSNNEPGNEMIILEDLNRKNFKMKRSKLDEEHCRLIFKTYGEFHAVSFCLKSQSLKQFKNLVISSKSILKKEDSTDQIIDYLKRKIKQTVEMLKRCKQTHLVKMLQPYIKNTRKLFLNSVKYKGNKRCFLHGDSKCSNMMFKYNVSTKFTLVYISKCIFNFRLEQIK